MSGLLIIGASYAGVQVAISAREAGYAAPIRIVADEAQLPYQRPPLSKAFLSGELAERGLVLRGEDFFKTQKIDLLLGRRAVAIDRVAKRVALQDGETLGYDKLVIATGSRARPLVVPGHQQAHIAYLRTLDEAIDLKQRLAAAQDVVIIGGGFIGLEVAATAAKANKKVTLIEVAGRLLERAVSPTVSQFLLETHRAHGVDIRFNQTVQRIDDAGHGRNDVVCADLIVAGIGGIANDDLASAAGIACSNGIDVDEFGQTDAPDIFAAGDCSNHPNALAGRRVRLESVQNAMDQGKAAGATLAGKREPYTSIPRFWSDQYDVKLQTVGLSPSHDQSAIRGAIDQGRFSVFYYRGGRLIAVDSINRPGDQMIARRLIAASLSPTPEQVADLAFDLKTLETAG